MTTVLQVLPSLAAGGGVERGTLEISRALAAAGWGSLIVTGHAGDEAAAAAAGARHAALPAVRRNPLQAPGAIRRLARLIADEDVDLVHARSRWPAWLAFHAARRRGRPFVTTVHGAYSTGGPLKRRYNAIMARGDPRRLSRAAADSALILPRANCLSPGKIFFEDGVWDRRRREEPERFQAALARNPTGRMGTPEEVADAVGFLASPISGFTTGANLVVDGGLTQRVQY